MKKIAAIFLLSFCCLSGCLPVAAKTNHSPYPQTRAAHKREKKQQKAMRKALKKQTKAQNKMYKKSVKKSHYPKHSY